MKVTFLGTQETTSQSQELKARYGYTLLCRNRGPYCVSYRETHKKPSTHTSRKFESPGKSKFRSKRKLPRIGDVHLGQGHLEYVRQQVKTY